MPPDPGAEARDRLGRSDLDPLWREARRRLEETARPVARLTLHGLSAGQREAIADLLGWARLPEPDISISMAALDRALLASPVGLDVRGLVEALGGPLVDRAELRRAARDQREQLWAWLASQPVVAAEPSLHAWVDSVREHGLACGSVELTRRELTRAVAVLDALPADGRPLSSFAEQV
ncbi:MAG: TIGR02679 domain-containing protein, partial [bacterium]|nr:TIGR02679 domain-containing protein [bacterium]